MSRPLSQVKWLYNQYAKDVPPYKGSVPEYPTWFESSVMQWLNENDDVSLEYLNGAFARDKKDGVSIFGETWVRAYSAIWNIVSSCGVAGTHMSLWCRLHK